MPSVVLLLQLIHVGAVLALLASAATALARPGTPGPARTIDIAAAVLAAFVMPLTGEAGWWIDMPTGRMVPALGILALGPAALGSRSLVGRPTTFALAAFFAVLGAASLRNGGPLGGFMAAKAIVLGLVLALLPWKGAARPRLALMILLLVAGAGLGVHKDLPFV